MVQEEGRKKRKGKKEKERDKRGKKREEGRKREKEKKESTRKCAEVTKLTNLHVMITFTQSIPNWQAHRNRKPQVGFLGWG